MWSQKQQTILDVPNSRDVIISGGPASGKTMVLIQRILDTHFENFKNNIVILTFSVPLANKISSVLQDNSVESGRNLNGIFCGTLETYCYQLLKKSRIKCNMTECMVRFQTNINNISLEPVTHCFIDEAQEINSINYVILNKLFGKTIKTIVGDPNGTLYEYIGANSTFMYKLAPKAIKFELDTNFRCPENMVKFLSVLNVNQKFIKKEGRIRLIEANYLSDADRLNLMTEVISKYICTAMSLLVLVPSSKHASYQQIRSVLEKKLNGKGRVISATEERRENDIVLATLHSIKGVEFENVVLLHFYHPAYRWSGDELKRLLAYAISRSTKNVDLIETMYNKTCMKINVDTSGLTKIVIQKADSTDETKIVVEKTRKPRLSITEILSNLSPESIAICSGFVPKCFVISNGNSFDFPKKLRRCDASIYGKFLEMVIARELSSTTLPEIKLNKTYVSPLEYSMFVKGTWRNDKFLISKLKTSGVSLDAIQLNLRIESNVTNALSRSNIVVSSDTKRIYESFDKLKNDILIFKNREYSTEACIEVIWRLVAQLEFIESSTTVYLSGHLSFTAIELLPEGAVSWKNYLNKVSSILPEKKVQHYQKKLSYSVGSTLSLVGISDIMFSDGTILDVKSCLSLTHLCDLPYTLQVGSYLAMAKKNVVTGYLLSGITLMLVELTFDSTNYSELLSYLISIA